MQLKLFEHVRTPNGHILDKTSLRGTVGMYPWQESFVAVIYSQRSNPNNLE